MAPPKRSRLRLVLAASLLLVAGAGLVRGLRGPEVGAWRVSRGTLVERVVASGQVMPPARVSLAALSLAQVREVRVREGDRVGRGQLLLQLDAAEAEALLGAARAGQAQAQARLAQVKGTGARVAAEGLRQAEVKEQQAEERLRRAEALAAGGSSSEQELSDARRALDLARSQAASAAAQAAAAGDTELQLAVAGLAQARAQLLLAEARLAQTRLLAPADGLVLLRACEPGDVVTAGRPLLVLSTDGDTRLTVQPDEKSLPLLRPGQPARAAADAFPGEPFDAEVLSVAPSVDPARGTVEVRLRVARPPAFLRPDMTVSVNVEVSRREGVLRVPAEAVRGTGGDTWALVVAGGRAERRPLQVGLRGQGAVEVKAGLAEGEWVVPPSARLQPGDRARAAPLPEPDRAL